MRSSKICLNIRFLTIGTCFFADTIFPAFVGIDVAALRRLANCRDSEAFPECPAKKKFGRLGLICATGHGREWDVQPQNRKNIFSECRSRNPALNQTFAFRYEASRG